MRVSWQVVLDVATVWCFLCGMARATTIVDFDEGHSLPAGEYWNGSDLSGGFTSNGAFFNNNFTDWGEGFYSWDGWAYSNVSDKLTAGYGNQYAAYTGSDFGGSGNYGVAYGGGAAPYINLPAGRSPFSIQVTNTTYAALSMRDGDGLGGFAKQFGGVTGNDPDWFSLTMTGYDGIGGTGAVTGSTTFYLADYRFANNAQDYIVDAWQPVDLTPLGYAKSIRLAFGSSDTGIFGINTPTYAAFDNLTTVPEPSTIALLVTGLATLAWRWRRKS